MSEPVVRVVHREQHRGEVAAEVLVDHAAGHLERDARLEAGLEVGAQRVAQEGRALQRAAAVARDVAEDEPTRLAVRERERVVEVAAGRRTRRPAGRRPRCAARRACPAPAAAARSAAGRPPGAARGAGGRGAARAGSRRSSRAPSSTESAARAASAALIESGTTSTMSRDGARSTGEPPPSVRCFAGERGPPLARAQSCRPAGSGSGRSELAPTWSRRPGHAAAPARRRRGAVAPADGGAAMDPARRRAGDACARSGSARGEVVVGGVAGVVVAAASRPGILTGGSRRLGDRLLQRLGFLGFGFFSGLAGFGALGGLLASTCPSTASTP